MKSASRPVGNKKLKELREKRKIKAQMRKETQRAMRYHRDLDSDWTVKNNQPLFGMKEHAAIDVDSGLVLSTCVSKVSEHDTCYFSYVVTMGIHGKSHRKEFMLIKGTVVSPTGTF